MNHEPAPRDELLQCCLSKLNWNHSMDLLSPILPSSERAVAISGEISSFVDDPLDAEHINRLMSIPNHSAFMEKTASYSSFSAESYGSIIAQVGAPEAGRLSRVSSCKFLKSKESSIQSFAQLEMGDGEFGSGMEDSSVTNPASATGDTTVKKRRAAAYRSKGKVAEENDLNAKKCRSAESTKKKEVSIKPREDQNGGRKNGKVNGSKAFEPSTDYIHVRARRGQATDSHSLAERVRREKISQRMKLLQDLVPGCSKITGKALMLDEIINYVQSLQRQVEFLSMKLATLNPRLDFNLENLITKEFLTNQSKASVSNSLYPIGNLPAVFPFGHQSKEGDSFPLNVSNIIEPSCSMSQYEAILYQPSSMESSFDIFGGAASQVGNLLNDVLHNNFQAGFEQNQQNHEIGVASQSFHGQLSTTNMKIEY